MKQILILIALCIATFASTPAYAQQKEGDHAQKMAARSTHLASILGLDDAGSKRFIELYTAYAAEMKAARQKYARIRPTKTGNGAKAPLTDQQIKTNLDNQFTLAQSILDIRKKYHAEYLKFLTPRQVERLYNLEKKGGEHLRKLYSKQANGKPGKGGKQANGKPGKGSKNIPPHHRPHQGPHHAHPHHAHQHGAHQHGAHHTMR